MESNSPDMSNLEGRVEVRDEGRREGGRYGSQLAFACGKAGNPDVSISSSFSFPRVITLPNVHDSHEKAGSQVRGVEFRSRERVLRKSSTRAVAVGQILWESRHLVIFEND